MSFGNWSIRISCLTVSILGMLIFMLYRGTLNASLNVKRTELAINSWNDVLASHKDFLVWEGASAASGLKHSSDPIQTRVYCEKALATPSQKNLQQIGYEDAREEIMKGRAVAYSHSTPFLIMPDYPCGIVDVPSLT